MSYMINDPVYNVNGLFLPDMTTIRIQCFADDTALYLQGTHDNMERTFQVL
jgi:hypothetical protein